MAKLDLKKQFKQLYTASAKAAAMVDVPEMSWLMVDGKGDPNTAAMFQEAVQALYGVAYTLKFMLKKAKPARDYGVMPLEWLWWMDDMRVFSAEKKDQWKWTLLIMQPDFITKQLFEQARKELAAKKDLPILSKLRFERWREGLAAQILHVGPYAEEGPTVQKLHQFAKEQGYQLHGKHHEVYLGDPRRSAPEKLKTILRQPVEKK
jgi:hypothetical protein